MFVFFLGDTHNWDAMRFLHSTFILCFPAVFFLYLTLVQMCNTVAIETLLLKRINSHLHGGTCGLTELSELCRSNTNTLRMEIQLVKIIHFLAFCGRMRCFVTCVPGCHRCRPRWSVVGSGWCLVRGWEKPEKQWTVKMMIKSQNATQRSTLMICSSFYWLNVWRRQCCSRRLVLASTLEAEHLPPSVEGCGGLCRDLRWTCEIFPATPVCAGCRPGRTRRRRRGRPGPGRPGPLQTGRSASAGRPGSPAATAEETGGTSAQGACPTGTKLTTWIKGKSSSSLWTSQLLPRSRTPAPLAPGCQS